MKKAVTVIAAIAISILNYEAQAAPPPAGYSGVDRSLVTIASKNADESKAGKKSSTKKSNPGGGSGSGLSGGSASHPSPSGPTGGTTIPNDGTSGNAATGG